MNDPLSRLKYHVTGAIERGEAAPIAGIEKQATHTIKPGCGYWDATRYPIGGKFCRVPYEGNGLPVILEHEPRRTNHGFLAGFVTLDGSRKLWTGLDYAKPE